jgi:hypothetical protein
VHLKIVEAFMFVFGTKLIFILILEEILYFKLPQNIFTPGKAYNIKCVLNIVTFGL